VSPMYNCGMPPARFVLLTPEEDDRLRQIEHDSHLKPKVRLRAQVLRLSGRGEGVERIAPYTGRSLASVLRDLDRWEKRGFEGLADGPAPANPPRISGEARAFMEQRLSDEERTWRTPLSSKKRSRCVSGSGSRRRPYANICSPWATVGNAPATCPLPARRTPKRNAKPEIRPRGAKKGAEGGEHVLKYLLDESGFFLCACLPRIAGP
jgi:hypothetical protein